MLSQKRSEICRNYREKFKLKNLQIKNALNTFGQHFESVFPALIEIKGCHQRIINIKLNFIIDQI